MNIHFADFNLPKEFSKKKKIDLMIGKFFPKDTPGDKELEWDIGMDTQKVFLTTEQCCREVLEKCIHEGMTRKELIDSYIAITYFKYPLEILNEVPLRRDPMDHPIDCEFDENTLSFLFTFRNNKTFEDISIAIVRVKDVVLGEDEKALTTLQSFTVYPVVDFTRF